MCESRVGERTTPLSLIEEALRRLDTELAEVGQDRPKVDRYARELSDELVRVGQELEDPRTRAAAVVSGREETRDRFSLDERRLQVARRELLPGGTGGGVSGRGPNALERLDAQIRELESVADPEAKAERVGESKARYRLTRRTF